MAAAARVALAPGNVRLQGHRCGCTAGPCNNAPEGGINGRIWSVCPFGHARNPAFLAAASLTKALDCGAVAGWPFAFSAAVEAGVYAIRRERVEHEAREIEKRRSRGR